MPSMIDRLHGRLTRFYVSVSSRVTRWKRIVFGVPDYTMTETNEATDSDADIYEAVETDGAEVTVDPDVAGPSPTSRSPTHGHRSPGYYQSPTSNRSTSMGLDTRSSRSSTTAALENAGIDASEIIAEVDDSLNAQQSSNSSTQGSETGVQFDSDSVHNPFIVRDEDTDE